MYNQRVIFIDNARRAFSYKVFHVCVTMLECSEGVELWCLLSVAFLGTHRGLLQPYLAVLPAAGHSLLNRAPPQTLNKDSEYAPCNIFSYNGRFGMLFTLNKTCQYKHDSMNKSK